MSKSDMAYDLKSKHKMHVYETVSASGTIYLNLDDQLVLAQSFQQHIKIHVVYDKLCEPVFTPDHVQISQTHDEDEVCTPSDVQISQTLYKNEDLNDTMIESVALPPCPVEQEQILTKNYHSQAVDIDKQLIETEFSNDELTMIVKEDTASNPINSNTSQPTQPDLNLISSEAVNSVCWNIDEQNDKSVLIDNGDLKKVNRCSKRLSHSAVKSDKMFSISSREYSKAVYAKNVTSKETNVSLNISLAHLENRNYNVPESINSHSGELNKDTVDSENEDDCSKPRKTTRLQKLKQEKEVFCEYCKKTFRSQYDYFEHRKVKTASYKCEHCTKVVAFKSHLLVHMRIHKADEDWLSSRANKTHEAATESNVSEKGINCDICGISVSSIRLLKTHTMVHTGEFAYKCCVCGVLILSLEKCKSHLTTHLKVSQVHCKICNIGFLSRVELSKHQLTHEFKCNICVKVFPNKISRDFHYKKDHKEDILKCHICGKMYSSNVELVSHLKYHRHQSKTQCTLCGMMVFRLYDHMLSHDNNVLESAIYVCDQCPKQFNRSRTFMSHMKFHSQEKPYVCIECPKRFTLSGGLRRHMKTHTQEKPFVCEICGKACSRMENLRVHMKVHKDIKSVQCKGCGESFSYKNALQVHMKTAHCVEVNNIWPETIL